MNFCQNSVKFYMTSLEVYKTAEIKSKDISICQGWLFHGDATYLPLFACTLAWTSFLSLDMKPGHTEMVWPRFQQIYGRKCSKTVLAVQVPAQMPSRLENTIISGKSHSSEEHGGPYSNLQVLEHASDWMLYLAEKRHLYWELAAN